MKSVNRANFIAERRDLLAQNKGYMHGGPFSAFVLVQPVTSDLVSDLREWSRMMAEALEMNK